MEDCIFCKIVAGDLPASIVYQDEELLAFPDINSQAPVHLLIIPKKHISALNELSDADSYLAGDMTRIANELAVTHGIAEAGYRLVINCGEQGGQGVDHLHMHLLGGRQLSNSLG